MKILSFLNSFRDEEISKKLEFLQNNKLFDKIPRKDLIYVLEALQERTYIRGETVFSEGDIGRALFMVMSGRIDLFKKMPDGSFAKDRGRLAEKFVETVAYSDFMVWLLSDGGKNASMFVNGIVPKEDNVKPVAADNVVPIS